MCWLGKFSLQNYAVALNDAENHGHFSAAEFVDIRYAKINIYIVMFIYIYIYSYINLCLFQQMGYCLSFWLMLHIQHNSATTYLAPAS